MKRQWDYPYFVRVCGDITQQLKMLDTDIELVAVTRGGLTAAHRIAYNLNLPLNFFDPKRGELAFSPDRSDSMLIFIEDLVAQGRTYDIVQNFMCTLPNNWLFCPLLVDAKYTALENVPIRGVISEDWIVFPYENFEQVEEGDRGLFREGTAASARKET